MIRSFAFFAFPLLAIPSPAAEPSAADCRLEMMPLVAHDARHLPPGAETSFSVDVPELSEREKKADAGWRGVVAVDLYGTRDGNGRITLEAVDADSGEVLGSGSADVEGRPPLLPWAVIFSSENPKHRAARAFTNQAKSEWISEVQEGREEWIGLQFGTPTRMTGVRYLPRTWRRASGVAKKYRVEIRHPGGDWETIASGERTKDPWSPLDVTFPGPVDVEAFRFVIESDWNGSGAGSAARIEVPGVTLDPVTPLQAASRAWVEIPPAIMKQLEGKSFGLRVRNDSENSVAIGEPRIARVNLAPDRKLMGSAIRTNGPNKLGAGLLGFDALTVHQQTVLSIMHVRPDTAAAGKQLRQGDVILAVQGRPLPVNSCAPGWDWFHHSHEAVIGRATETALQAGKKNLTLTVLRDGKPGDIEVPLNRQAPFTTVNPMDDPEAARMLDDCLAFLARTQRDDGSWSRCIIRTSFSALAMLATGEEEHIERARKAVEWSKARYKQPANYGNLGFWHGAYAGILYSEWHLATGDATVMPNLEALRDWTVAGQHDSAFGIPALGHGPPHLPYKRRGLVAPACHLLVAEALAMRGGMESGIWEMILPFMERSWSDPAEGGHGALGYFPAQRDNSQHWSRSGLFAIAAHLRGERTDMRDAMIQSMHETYPRIRNSHAYGEPGGALGLLALNLVAPEIYAEVIGHYAWWFSLAWEPGHGLRFTTPHQGAPYMGEEDLINAAYALVLQAPRRSLHLTGKP